MPRKKVVQIDQNTGQELHGALIYVAPKQKVYSSGYVAMSQEGLQELLDTYKVTTQQLFFIARILRDIGYQNVLPYTASTFGKIYHYSTAYACKMFKQLYDLGILVDYHVEGRNRYYALNSNIGWKGKPKDWYDNTLQSDDMPGAKALYMVRLAAQDFILRG